MSSPGDGRRDPSVDGPGAAGPAMGVVADEIGRSGPIPFSRYMELALYAPGAGFYETGGAAGRARGDFLTSPEVGPLFGAVLARALDTWWDDLGQPDPYVVADAGAGPGTLAVAVRAAAPRCAPALHYVLVERSAAQRAGHGQYLELRPSDGARPLDADQREGPRGLDASDAIPGTGPHFVSQPDLPAEPFTGVILANELLDNLPFDVLERAGGRWSEVGVGLQAGSRSLTEVLVPASTDAVAQADRLAPDAPDGTRIPWQRAAGRWLEDALARVEAGRVVVIDYAADAAELQARGYDWLRTYQRHGPGSHPLEDPGTQDITADLVVETLADVLPPTSVRTQADFLVHHGIEVLVAEGRRIWAERAHLGDLEAIRARSRIIEAEALVDRSGLGAFRVLEWDVGG